MIYLIICSYTNGDVKYWDVATGDSCIFRPSNTSLSIAEDYEMGTEQNIVESVVTSDNITAALYRQGNIGYHCIFLLVQLWIAQRRISSQTTDFTK